MIELVIVAMYIAFFWAIVRENRLHRERWARYEEIVDGR